MLLNVNLSSMYAKPKTKKSDPAVTDTQSVQHKGVSMPAVPVLQEAVAQRDAVAEKETVQAKFETKQLKEDEESPLQGKFETTQLKEDEQPVQGKFAARATAQLEEIATTKPNNTGLPDQLKTGVESLSGMSMDHVKVHYSSDKPSQLNAHAYAQGSDIHVAPGQEKHLPHEAWHIVQQAQGRVRPTMQMKGSVPVNDDKSLEHEADVMGSKAATVTTPVGQLKENKSSPNGQVAQLAGTKPNQPTVDGRFRVKLSSEREEFTYRNRAALGLDAVLPQHHRIRGKKYTSAGKIEAIMIDGDEAWRFLKEPIDAPGSDQKVLCIDTVGWEDESEKEQKDKKCVLDVKIGTYTKSGEQFALEGAGAFKRFFKKIEHNLKDLNRDSRKLGYDIDSGNLTEFLKLATNKRTSAQLHAAMIAVRSRLLAIKARLATAPITFVGSSLFLVFNLTNPQASDVKLIDPDHPIVTDPGELQMPDQLVRSSQFTGERSWENYVRKWKTGFGTGMDKFLEWFDNLAGTGG